MTSSLQKMQANMHKIKMMINKKGGCNDIFVVFCQLQFQIRQVLKENQHNQKHNKEVKKSYENQLDGIQKHLSARQKMLEDQNKYLRAEMNKLQQKMMNNSMKSLDFEIASIQSKYSNYQTDEVYKLLKEQIQKLKKQIASKNQIIRKLKNSDGYTMTYKSGSTGVSGVGKKLGGYDFSKPTTKGFNNQNRDDDFDGLDTGFRNKQ